MQKTMVVLFRHLADVLKVNILKTAQNFQDRAITVAADIDHRDNPPGPIAESRRL